MMYPYPYPFYPVSIRGHRDMCDQWGAMRPSGWTDKGWKRAKRRGVQSMVGVYDPYRQSFTGNRVYRLYRYGLTP